MSYRIYLAWLCPSLKGEKEDGLKQSRALYRVLYLYFIIETLIKEEIKASRYKQDPMASYRRRGAAAEERGEGERSIIRGAPRATLHCIASFARSFYYLPIKESVDNDASHRREELSRKPWTKTATRDKTINRSESGTDRTRLAIRLLLYR